MAAKMNSLAEAPGVTETVHLTAEDVAAINEGVADIRAGRVHAWEDVKKEMQQRLTDAKKKSPAG